MFDIDIPGFGSVKLHHLVTDFTGTLSCDGKLIPGVKERLLSIAGFLNIHVLTSDTFRTAASELQRQVTAQLRVARVCHSGSS